jgi:hypothetical protein
MFYFIVVLKLRFSLIGFILLLLGNYLHIHRQIIENIGEIILKLE